MSSAILTLDEILAKMGQPVFAKSSDTEQNQDPILKNPKENQSFETAPKAKTAKPNVQTSKSQNNTNAQSSNSQTVKSPKISKTKQPNPTPLDFESIKNADLAEILKNTPRESLAELDREKNYLRWLAFYYLSKREHSQKELKAKLLAKGCEPSAVAELLDEFAQKGYQSNERTALMVVRESVRAGRGKRHIEQKLWQYGLDLPYSLDELIAMAGESVSDGTVVENEEEIDWLKLAVEARCKKYGNAIPKDPKEKARQLRFLQYRGFSMDICFDALKVGLDDLVD